MSAFQVSATLQRDPPMPKHELELFGDSLMDALLDLEVPDAAVSVTFSQSTVEIELTVEADNAPSALQQAQEVVRQALSALHLSLVDYPDDDEPDEWTIRRNRILAPA